MKAVLQWVLRTMMKDQTGIVQTMPKKDLVDFNVAMTAERLMRNGVDPNALKNADQVENALNMIDNAPRNQTMSIGEARGSGIKSAKIIDMEGKEIDPRSKIMGGKRSETEAEIAERLGRENKEGIARIKNKKMIEEAIDNVSPGFVKGDNKYNAEIVAEEIANKRGLDYYDMDAKQRADIYGEAFDALMKMRDDLAQGGRAGFFLGGPNPKGLGLLRQILNYMSKKGKETGRFQGADLSALDMLRLSNPKALNRLLEDVRGKVNIREGIMGTDTVSAQQQALREKRKGLTEKSLDVAKAMKAKDIKIKRRIAEEAEYTIIPQIKKQLMEGMGMSEEAAEKAARDMAEAAQNMRLADDPPIITKEGLLQLENVLKNLETGGKKARDLNADGGRIGFKDGMDRRSFLKIMGGLAALPIVGKFFKLGKGADAVKNLPPIKTPVTKLEGTTTQMPEWFPSFINKFRDEGKAENVFKQKKVEVTKAEYDKAIAEGKGENYYTDVARTPEYKAYRGPDHMDYFKLEDTDERIYTTYTNDKVPGVRVDDMDGNIDVMFENEYSQPVSLNYTAPGKRGPEAFARADTFVEGEAKMETKPKGDFVANDVEVYATSPDGDTEAVDVIANTVDDMMEGTTRQMEEYVTGKKTKLSRGEGRIIEAEIRAEQAADAAAEAEAAAEAADDFASGGIARMLGE